MALEKNQIETKEIDPSFGVPVKEFGNGFDDPKREIKQVNKDGNPVAVTTPVTDCEDCQ